MFGLNALDAIVIIVVLANAVMGIRRGFTTESLKLVAWAGAIFITIVTQPFAVGLVSSFVTIELVANIIALGAVFLSTLVLLNYLGKFIGERIKSSFLGPIDRLLGSVFGFLRGAIIVSGTYLALSFFIPEKDHPEWVTEARLIEPVKIGAVVIASVTPDLFDKAGNFATGYSEEEREDMDELVEDVSEDS